MNRDTAAYCKNCGQPCEPEQYKRPAEEHEKWRCSTVQDWRSPCCKDKLSEDPVSDYCENCGDTADLTVNEKFRTWRGMVVCPLCRDSFIRDEGPDPEDLLEDNWRKDR